PETVVDGLRVLGVRATPAELHPGQVARLEALVVDPSRPGRRNTVVWLGCDPDPFDLGRSACSDPAVLSNPSALGGAADGGVAQLPTGMHAIGFNEVAGYAAPPDTFAQVPEGDPRRQRGTVAQVLALAVAEEVSPAATPEEISALLARVRAKEVKSVIALFRIRITEEAAVNQNPSLAALLVDEVPLPEGATLRVAPVGEVRLETTVPEGTFEDYQVLQPEGPLAKTEKVVAAWYSSWGRFAEARVSLRSELLPEGGVARFTPPGGETEPMPDDRAGAFYVVLRDTRGGQTWAQYPGFLCDASLPAPVASALSPTSGPADGNAPLSLTGTDLDQALDVLVGGKALVKGAWSPARGRFEGALPRLAPGEYPVLVRGKNCADVQTGLSYRAN
ncbi:MAG: IPT/TIG domain-containing protein, partial [Myxococcaceae bacterium]